MEKNPETMSLEELRQLALEHMGEEQPVVEQPKKDQAQPQQDEEVVYQRTIDLGDGSGVQVFEAPTMEELIDKLAKAQENATRKIREQAQQLRDKPAPVQQAQPEAELTPEQKWLLQQRLANEPEKVIEQFVDETFKKKYGKTIEEIEAFQHAQVAEQTAQQWVDATSDYYASPKNGAKMKKYLETYGLDQTAENLQKAFEDLSSSGLLEARPQDKESAAATEEQVTEPAKRIVTPAAPVNTVRRKVVGEVSTKRQAPVEAPAPGLTEKQLYEMPMADLEQLMLQHFKA